MNRVPYPSKAIYPAANAHLKALILRRAGSSRELQQSLITCWFRPAAGKSPRLAYDDCLMQAALVIVQSVYAYSWADICTVLDTRAGRDTTWQGAERRREAERLLIHRIEQAKRRLDSIIKAGLSFWLFRCHGIRTEA